MSVNEADFDGRSAYVHAEDDLRGHVCAGGWVIRGVSCADDLVVLSVSSSRVWAQIGPEQARYCFSNLFMSSAEEEWKILVLRF